MVSLTSHIPRLNYTPKWTPASSHIASATVGHRMDQGAVTVSQLKKWKNSGALASAKKQKSVGPGYKKQTVACLEDENLVSEMYCLGCIENLPLRSKSFCEQCCFMHFHWLKNKGPGEYVVQFRCSTTEPDTFDYHEWNPSWTAEHVQMIQVWLLSELLWSSTTISLENSHGMVQLCNSKEIYTPGT